MQREARFEPAGRRRSPGFLLLFALLVFSMGAGPATAPEPLPDSPESAPSSAGPRGLKAFFGSLHDHSAEGGDDGRGTMEQAFRAARARGFDFMGLSPHHHMIRPETYGTLLERSRELTEPGAFVALPGTEWGIISHGGHVGVVGGTELCEVSSRDWSGFWGWVAGRPEATVQVMHHPVWNRRFGGTPDPARARDAHLMEIMGGPANWRGGPGLARAEFYVEAYSHSLNQGWRTGVVAGQDDHTARWGQIGPTRTGVWAPELTRPALLEALAARRTFATEDSRMRLWIEVDGKPMGSQLAWKGPGASYELRIHVEHGSGEVPELAVYADLDGVGGGIARELLRPGAARRVTLEPSQSGSYVFVAARDRDEDVAISSPIWLGPALRYLSPEEEGGGVFRYKPDPNFAASRWLEEIPGIGEGTARRIAGARRRGHLFLEPEDLRQIKGVAREIWQRVLPRLLFRSPEEHVDYLVELESDLHSLVIPRDKKEFVEMQLRRVERLLAAQLVRLLERGGLERARSVRTRLRGLGEDLLVRAERVDRAVRQAMLDAGRPELAEALLRS